MKTQEELAELAKDLAESVNINDENLAELRNTISQKQSRLNALLSAKESLNSSIKQYPDLFQTSYWTYIFHQNLQTLQNIESEISRYDQSIAHDKSYLAFLEDKLDDVNGVGVDSEGRNITNADGALPIHVAAESGNVDMSFDYSLIEDYLNYDSFIKDLPSTDISIHSGIFDDSLLYPSETAMLGDLSIDLSI